MKLVVTINLNITPGTLSEADIRADVDQAFRDVVLGVGYGPLKHTVDDSVFTSAICEPKTPV